MKNKKLITVAATIVVAALGAGAWLWYQSRQAAPTGEVPAGSSYGVTVPVNPTPPTGVDTSTNTLPLPTQSGGSIKVQDFIPTSRLLPGEEFKNYLLEENDAFTVGYSASDQSFFISLTQAPFDVARANAEAALLQKLNIPKERACSLKVTVGIPRWASESAIGTEYGLSWCPFSVPVPSN